MHPMRRHRGRAFPERRCLDTVGKGNVTSVGSVHMGTPGEPAYQDLGGVVHRSHNGLKTAALLGLMSALILVVGAAVGGRGGLIIAFIIALGFNAVSYFFSDKIALASMRARPVSEAEQPAMYRIVNELSTARRAPMPRLFVRPTNQPNAFATGRNPRHAAVCCTEGILGMLDERELRGVLGHELSHVYNRDILISSIAGALATLVLFLAHFAQFAAI